ncbi:selenocysteine lyase/cysteine desulfurase [Homoserinimonas aerilata]|uniref:Selenocysteine lyase/cysteine desulfurase n=1 Tax=Homoserinimonas aerilata TaxID=1162970 RepID=A0A542YGT2_9MICO|nr:aminotransferase class V-fold PLP-dependent enzyme [Homoserinimonas aerilata]TQL47292.1 selenocysteine lyase/cysteine desulfurase [Homoserinimonas aerilata]
MSEARAGTVEEFAAQFDEEPGYLDFARLGPLGLAVVEEERMHAEFLRRARFGSLDQLLGQDVRVREAASVLTGFAPEQIVFQPDTSTGLMHAMFGLTGQVALSPAEFPSLRYAVVRAQQALGLLSPVWLEAEHNRVTPGTLREQLTPEVTAVAVSLVDYRTGYLADLDGIRQVIGDRLLIVDAVQGFGVVDAPWELADVVASGGQKWVRAGMGTGILALSDRAAERLVPMLSGWMAGPDVQEGEDVADAVAGAGAFRITHPNPIAQARMGAAMEAISLAGIDRVQAAISANVDRVLALVDEFGIPVTSPRSEAERAGIIVLTPAPDQFTVLSAALYNHGITVSQRDGSIRISVHVSTSEETFELLRSALLGFASATRA